MRSQISSYHNSHPIVEQDIQLKPERELLRLTQLVLMWDYYRNETMTLSRIPSEQSPV